MQVLLFDVGLDWLHCPLLLALPVWCYKQFFELISVKDDRVRLGRKHLSSQFFECIIDHFGHGCGGRGCSAGVNDGCH
jgi:hypothetical protein